MTTSTDSSKAQATADAIAREPRQFIAMGANRWARADTQDQAVKELKKRLGRGAHEAQVFEVPAGSGVNDMGGIQTFPPDGMTWDQVDPQVYGRVTEVAQLTVRK